MTELRTHIDNNGRVLIPAQIRKEFNIKPGDVFVMRTLNQEIRMVALNKAIKEAQNLIREYVPENFSLVTELIRARKEDAERD